MFRFKQFSVDQSGCAMKINTDGVLLGAFAGADDPEHILDIGTGTGVIALMLAQKYLAAKFDAVEIDEIAAQTADKNFKSSPFAERLTIHALGFDNYFDHFPIKKYDLIVSNPPFYTDSLKSPEEKKALAKHASIDFFEELIERIAAHLVADGLCWLILPSILTEKVTKIAAGNLLYLQKIINIQSYTSAAANRVILCFGFEKMVMIENKFIIYGGDKKYSDEYQKLLEPYFTIF